ncbi:MAG TPA: PPK2 family polyphosphate kinase [Acidimicrobiales bacterium]|jgi:PPK2 family polyphosphate:nucleotide phosphotransferase|nr:PPK2 family polyphosphate kinase [Acidimicrobiales bacterium]
MKLPKDCVRELMVEPGKSAGLKHRSTSTTRTDWLGALGHAHPKEVAERDLDAFKADLLAAQGLLYAADRWSLLLVFQALDAGGKDGTIKHVMSGVDPQGCDVVSFKQPSEVELRHDFLWRCAARLPERGHIGIFNRSYYEDVLVVRVHSDLAARRPAGAADGDAMWRERFDDINAFERHLVRNGTRVVKFFLHVSDAEQRARLLARLDDPDKQWKFSPTDLAEHRRYPEYQIAYEEAITATSTSWAPWYVVPADHKYALRALVGGIIVEVIDELDLSHPRPDAAQRAAIEEAAEALRAEG